MARAVTVCDLTGETSKTNKFTKINPLHCGPLRLNLTWLDNSSVSCASSCLARFPVCNGFIYNKATRLCTPSSGLSADQPPLAPHEGDFYFKESCQSYPDFSIKTNLSTQANVAYYNNTPLNYTNARVSCQCLNSHLYMADTLDKYWLLQAIINVNEYVHLGLDDIAVEGKFVWADSGQEINNTLKEAMFAAWQPDNWNDEEDCAYISPGLTTINDGNCKWSKSYICEKPLC